MVEPVEDTKFAIGEVYNFNLIDHLSLINLETLHSKITQFALKESGNPKKKNDTLKKLLRSIFGKEYGSALVDHVLCSLEIESCLKMTPNELLGDQPLLKKLGSGLSQADAIIQKCILEPQKGFIISRNFSLGNGVSPLPNLERIHANIATTGISVQDSEGERPILAYEEFHPYPFLQYQTKEFRVEEFKSFNEATDHYFSNLESQKINQKQAQAANASTQKLQAVKSAHTSQLEQFEKAQNQSLEYAMMIERNSSLVESVLQIIRGLVASGMDWVDIGNLVKQEKMNKNPVAGIIWGLKLDIGIITLGINRFADGVDDHDTEDCDDDDSGSDGESG